VHEARIPQQEESVGQENRIIIYLTVDDDTNNIINLTGDK
jgi:hypothetical protein